MADKLLLNIVYVRGTIAEHCQNRCNLYGILSMAGEPLLNIVYGRGTIAEYFIWQYCGKNLINLLIIFLEDVVLSQ